MSPALEQIKTAISKLPPADRHDLWRALSEEFEPPVHDDSDDPSVQAAWDEEIASRVQEIEDGTVQLVSAEEAERHTNALFAELHLSRQRRSS